MRVFGTYGCDALRRYPGMRIAAASSADTPHAVAIGRSALDLLEVRENVCTIE